MARAVVITGSNSGDRRERIDAAREALSRMAGDIAAASPVMSSEPWGEFAAEETTDDFLNQVLVLETPLPPAELLSATQYVEKLLGRERTGGEQGRKGTKPQVYASRAIDIDILFYDDRVVETDRLVIPHPLIAAREFVLRPLAAVMPDFRHPVTGESVRRMLEKALSSGMQNNGHA